MNQITLPSLGEVRAAHSVRSGYERFLFVNTYLFRPPSFPAIWLLIRLGVSSESVSWFSGLAALAGFACLLRPGAPLLWPGIALLMLFNFCDCLDGGIARAMRTRNPYGRFLDSSMSWADMFFWAVVGAAVWRMPSLRAMPWVRPEAWPAAGAAAALLFSYAAYLEGLFDVSLRGYWEELQAGKGVLPAPNPAEGSSGPAKIAKIALHNLRVRETQYVLFAAACLAGAADALLLFYLALYSALAVSLLFVYARRGRKVFDSGLGREA